MEGVEMQTCLLTSARAKILAAIALSVLVVMWVAAAYPRGMLMARIDVARGHFAIRSHGYPPHWMPQYARLLRDRYDVHFYGGGCMVFLTEDQYDDGYNAVSKPAIARRFGPGVFKECADLAQQEYQAKYGHPG
jgi:hypothetical protein